MRGKRKRPDPTKADAAALAEDLLWSWREEEGDGRGPFRSTLYGLLDADREDAIGLAVRIEAESRPGGVTWFPKYLLEEVEYVFAGSPIRGFRLFVVMITTKGTERPDPADFAECLIDSGFFEYKDRISFHPAWFPSAQVLDLPFCTVRRLVREMIEGKPPSVLRSGGESGPDKDIMLVGIEVYYPGSEVDDDWEGAMEIYESWRELSLKNFPDIEDVCYVPSSFSECRDFLKLG